MNLLDRIDGIAKRVEATPTAFVHIASIFKDTLSLIEEIVHDVSSIKQALGIGSPTTPVPPASQSAPATNTTPPSGGVSS